MKKLFSVCLCCCLLLGCVFPVMAEERGAAVPSTGAQAAGLSGRESALLRLEDVLFLLTERLRAAFACLDFTGMIVREGADDPFPKAKTAAKTLLLLDTPRGDEALALGSLQGVLANVSETQLLFREGSCRQYTEAMTDARVEERTGEAASAASLLKEFAPLVNGYVLCDEAGAQAAVSVAAALQAVVIPEGLQNAAEAAGLACREDARGWTDKTLRRSRYFAGLSKTVAFSQPVSYAPKLVDYAVMAGAYFGFSDSDSEIDCRRMYSFLKNNAVVFGWNPVLGEYGTVAALSSRNACLVPADHAANLSVLSGFPSVPLRQAAAEQSAEAEAGHTVCIFMSDGDNLQWTLNSFTDAAHYGSPLRGRFPMGWGVPASLNTAAPAMAQWLYANRSERDEMILQISGLGYTYPSKWRDPFALRRMYGMLDRYMEDMDLHIAAVLDDGGFSCRATDSLTAQESVSGVFYLDYSDYAGMRGAVRLSRGKPVISARYKLWSGLPGGSPEEIAAAVNASPKDPADPDAYSLIVVHAWSGLDGDGRFGSSGDTMAAVDRMVGMFDGDVRIVPPTTFAAMMTEAVKQSGNGGLASGL